MTMKSLCLAVWLLFGVGLIVPAPAWAQESPAGTLRYLVANDDLPPKLPTSGSFFTILADGTPVNPTRVNLGGAGSGGGYFASNRISLLNGAAKCAFMSMGGSSEISAVDIETLQNIGNFPASPTDSSFDNGLGLANNGTYLYASFSTSWTVGTFAILPGCGLQFLGDIAPLGLQGGNVKGMSVHGNLMVVAYGDGSIESFNIAAGIPVSNNDKQNATGFATDRYPNGVDITANGRFAIFGDMSTTTTVEVSDMSSGKLTRTILYDLGPAANSNNVYLSPDQTLLYIANNSMGRVTAAFFDKTTGKLKRGCTSPILRGFDDSWNFFSSPVTELTTGTGSVLYVSEFGAQSGIGIVNVTSSGGRCTLLEAPHSPAVDPHTTSLLSIGVFPPRPF